jgi:hypothetical protein
MAHCFWLLTRIAWSSRADSFGTDLRRLGIEVNERTSILTFVSQVSDQVRHELSRATSSGHFSEIASLALRRALTETIGQHGPSLFGSAVEDLQEAFRAHSSRAQFGSLSRRFFADVLARTLRSLVDRELSNQIGQSEKLTTVDETGEFIRALDTYARQSAHIMEDFAAGWYAKNNWESKGEITQEDARRFVGVALRKLRMELKLGAR